MKKLSLISVMVLLSATASAGEIKGPPGPDGAEGGLTPIAGFWTGDGAGSICSFSGLNDENNEEEPSQTQSYGSFLVAFANVLGISIREFKNAEDGLASPSDTCNPNAAPWGNPRTQ